MRTLVFSICLISIVSCKSNSSGLSEVEPLGVDDKYGNVSSIFANVSLTSYRVWEVRKAVSSGGNLDIPASYSSSKITDKSAIKPSDRYMIHVGFVVGMDDTLSMKENGNQFGECKTTVNPILTSTSEESHIKTNAGKDNHVILCQKIEHNDGRKRFALYAIPPYLTSQYQNLRNTHANILLGSILLEEIDRYAGEKFELKTDVSDIHGFAFKKSEVKNLKANVKFEFRTIKDESIKVRPQFAWEQGNATSVK